jgi:hypothetical protein
MSLEIATETGCVATGSRGAPIMLLLLGLLALTGGG